MLPTSSHSARSWLAPVVAIALGAIACEWPAARPARPRDLVLVLIDTLRADHVGVYGYRERPATPSLDRFARRGAWFSEAWATAPWTPPSVMSIMTSLEPQVHGMEQDAESYATRIPALPAATRTLAEVLKAKGYRTLAVTGGGGVGSQYGFARGFDRFYEPPQPQPEDVVAGVDRALGWLADVHEQPVFLFFHTYEVHTPNTHGIAVSGDDAPTAASRAYDADLAFADREIGRLLAALEPRLSHAVVVICGDHGENLEDRRLEPAPGVGHGHHLHEELLRVPFVVVAPGFVPPSGAISGPVQLTDVMPTALALVGAGATGLTMQGRDLSEALLRAVALDRDRPLFAAAPLQGPTWSAVRVRAASAIVTPPVAGASWWHRVAIPPVSLFDRDRDPHEIDNLATARPGELAPLLALLRQREESNRALRKRLGEPVDGAPAGAAGDALRALGYIGPRASPRASPAP